MAVAVRQVSFLDHVDLLGTARFGVLLAPRQVAEKYRLVIETSFDDLGAFDFLALSAAGGILGFRKYQAVPHPYSYVSVIPLRENLDRKQLIADVCGIAPGEVVEFDENW